MELYPKSRGCNTGRGPCVAVRPITERFDGRTLSWDLPSYKYIYIELCMGVFAGAALWIKTNALGVGESSISHGN